MADGAAAAAAAAYRNLKSPPIWNVSNTRYHDYQDSFLFWCDTHDVPENKRAGLLYEALPGPNQATVRRNCTANDIALRDVSVDNIHSYMSLTADVSDKSQFALRNAMKDLKFDGINFHSFMDKWTSYHELVMAVDPAMDENTAIWFFTSSLPKRLADLVRMDPTGAAWTNLRDLQRAASVHHQTTRREEPQN
jgi:hypothetical protein